METTRAACIREVQNSLKESVKQLLLDKIEKFGLGGQFEAVEGEIRGPHGSLIIFRGMQSYNAETIKSLEGYDIAWVEEAQTLSDRSLRMLRPTIRKEGSELWFSWNSRHDTDAVDKFLRGAGKPAGAIVIKVGWQDNPWLPSVLIDEKDLDYATDPEMAAHIWGGEYEIITEGSYYARQLAQAENEGRIGDFPYDPDLPVKTAWDIGVDDYTAIWFLQENGKRVRAIGYYETSGDGPQLIVPEALDSKPYRYSLHYLPHDVKVREWGAGAKSRVQTLLELGVKPINVGTPTAPSDRINAVRALLPIVDFDRDACAQGIARLRKYRRRFNQSLGTYTGEMHDENSHGADAFGEFAVNCPIIPKLPPPPAKNPTDRWSKIGRSPENNWKTM